MKQIIELIKKLQKETVYKGVGIALLIFISSVSELLTLSLFYELLNFLSNGEQTFMQDVLMDFFGKLSLDIFLIIFVAVLALALFLRLFSLREQLNYLVDLGNFLTRDLYEKTIMLEYKHFLEINTSRVISGIYRKSNDIVQRVMMPIFQSLNAVLVLVLTSFYFFIVYPSTAISVLSIGFILYFLFSILIQKRLANLAVVINDNQNSMLKRLNDSINSIREIKFYSLEKFYSKFIKDEDQVIRKSEATASFLGQFPKIVVEFFIFIGFSLFLFFQWAGSSDDLSSIIDVTYFGFLALYFLRVLPLIQQIYQGYTSLKTTVSVVEDYNEMHEQATNNLTFSKQLAFNGLDKISVTNLRKSIQQKELFQINNLNFEKRNSYGIYGKSGTGKSTFIRILLGLISADRGEILMGDNILETNSTYKLSNVISYVDQHPSIITGSVRENLSFGSVDFIDDDRMIKFLRAFNLFTNEKDCKMVLDKSVGEYGNMLSGGEKQRLAICRALLRKYEVLILDEATSALDSRNEFEIMKAVIDECKDKILILISHQDKVLEMCSQKINFNEFTKQ